MKDRDSGRLTVLAFARPDLAAIDKLRPTFILTSTGFQRELAAQLRAKGYRLLHFEPESIADIFSQTEQLGSALGKAGYESTWRSITLDHGPLAR